MWGGVRGWSGIYPRSCVNGGGANAKPARQALTESDGDRALTARRGCLDNINSS